MFTVSFDKIYGSLLLCLRIFLKDFIYLFARENMHVTGERQRKKQTPGWAGSPMWDLIPGPWDHDRHWSQILRLNHPVAPKTFLRITVSEYWILSNFFLHLSSNLTIFSFISLIWLTTLFYISIVNGIYLKKIAFFCSSIGTFIP